MSDVRLNNICKVYDSRERGRGGVLAVKNFSMDIRDGEFIVFVGPSGCGKTTLLYIIGGLDRYTDGDLYINGRSTKSYEDCDWDRYRTNTIGVLFQNYNLIMHQTTLSNV